MSDSSSSHMNLIVAAIGAIGAIGAALLPIYLTRSTPPAPAAPVTAGDAQAAPAPAAPIATPASPKVPEAKKSPKDGTDSESSKVKVTDLAKLQGVWHVVWRHVPNKELDREKVAAEKATWTFRGNELDTYAFIDGKDRNFRGKFTIHSGGEPKLLDFSGTGPGGKHQEWRAIYEFDGPVLKIAVRMKAMNSPDDSLPDRPKSFIGEAGERPKLLFRLRRLKE